ncbi:hypothetical protein K438DRAFT_1748342 [Mycena galopus ATCC 62051]|nr:hypothetical protein K438DRAFT_1748342 [Mycena galopus ATCC 62051]
MACAGSMPAGLLQRHDIELPRCGWRGERPGDRGVGKQRGTRKRAVRSPDIDGDGAGPKKAAATSAQAAGRSMQMVVRTVSPASPSLSSPSSLPSSSSPSSSPKPCAARAASTAAYACAARAAQLYLRSPLGHHIARPRSLSTATSRIRWWQQLREAHPLEVHARELGEADGVSAVSVAPILSFGFWRPCWESQRRRKTGAGGGGRGHGAWLRKGSGCSGAGGARHKSDLTGSTEKRTSRQIQGTNVGLENGRVVCDSKGDTQRTAAAIRHWLSQAENTGVQRSGPTRPSEKSRHRSLVEATPMRLGNESQLKQIGWANGERSGAPNHPWAGKHFGVGISESYHEENTRLRQEHEKWSDSVVAKSRTAAAKGAGNSELNAAVEAEDQVTTRRLCNI